jgi:hypothetical protein
MGMSFVRDLNNAAAPLTASEAAAAVSPLLSRRTMEDWLQGRRTPPPWTHDMILARVRARARRKQRRPQNGRHEPRGEQAPN